MEPDLTLSIVYRLLLAALLGGIVGLERELHHKAAGLRTNMFMCIGSALFTLLSEELGKRFGGDHARVAAQLIPGIGFIGAGAIIRDRGSVVGLTTAATIFVVASVGMAVGTGLYLTAIFATLLILLTLSILGRAEDRFSLKTHLMTFRITTSSLESFMPRAHDVMKELGVPMQHFQVFRVGPDCVMEFDAEVSSPQQHQVMQRLSAIEPRCECVRSAAQKE
jgi:putative Mg2+ transporter-C (MgtC) family protein